MKPTATTALFIGQDFGSISAYVDSFSEPAGTMSYTSLQVPPPHATAAAIAAAAAASAAAAAAIITIAIITTIVTVTITTAAKGPIWARERGGLRNGNRVRSLSH